MEQDVHQNNEVVKEKTEPAVTHCHNITPEMLLSVLQDKFGFSKFREGQQEAMMSILNDKPTLLIIPTGYGKSLCYQLFSYFRPQSLVIVVSPLLALMKDQLRNLPSFLNGGSFGSDTSIQENNDTLEKVRKGQIGILFVSPEKFTSETFIRMCASFPPIGLVCIDEAHCISEWSHNFRYKDLLFCLLRDSTYCLHPAFSHM